MEGAAAWILVASAMAVLVSCHQVCFIGSEYNPQTAIRQRWFLSHKDPCKCTAIRLGGMNMPASSYRQGAPHYLDELILSEDVNEIQDYFKCKGMSAIARPTTDDHSTAEGRPTTATSPTTVTRPTTDDHLTTKGRSTTAGRQTTATSPTTVSRPTTDDHPTTEGRPTTAGRQTTAIRPTTATRPTTGGHLTTCTAIETTATAECPDPQPLGMEDKTILNDHITASSEASRCPAWKGRLNYDGVWKPEHHDSNQWIEIDLTDSTLVSGVITKSFVRQHSGTTYDEYVNKYKVAYKELPASDYEHVRDADGNEVFSGNTDAATPVTNMFRESVMATVVRVEPTEWYDEIRLQLELLGCRLE